MYFSETQFEKKWKDKFSGAAKKDREDYKISLWTKEGLESYIKYFFKYFDFYIKKNNSQILLLDLGCGPGVFSKLLAQKGFQVYGVDFSSAMIKVAKKRTGSQKINYLVANIYNLPFKNGYFDAIICLGVFQQIEKPKEAIKEINRVLKKEGLAVITTLNCFSLFSLFSLFKKKDIFVAKRYNPYQLKATLKRENFDRVKLKGIYFSPFSFLTDFVIKFRLYKLFNLFFPFFIFFSHSFYVEGKKRL